MDSARRCWHDNDHHHDYLTRLLMHFSGDGKNILMVPFTVTNFLIIGARCGNKAPKQWKFWIITIFSPRMGESLGRYLRDLYSYRDAFRIRRYSQFGRFSLTRNQTISKISKYFGQWRLPWRLQRPPYWLNYLIGSEKNYHYFLYQHAKFGGDRMPHVGAKKFEFRVKLATPLHNRSWMVR